MTRISKQLSELDLEQDSAKLKRLEKENERLRYEIEELKLVTRLPTDAEIKALVDAVEGKHNKEQEG